MSGLLLDCLVAEFERLALILFSIAALGILVAFLVLGTTNAIFRMSKNRWVTSFLFLSWLRSSSPFKMSSESVVKRLSSLTLSLAFSSSDKPFDAFTSKVSTTLEATLLTFCPPEPELRTALYCTSEIILSVSIIGVGVPL